jgi:hypothetical protein
LIDQRKIEAIHVGELLRIPLRDLWSRAKEASKTPGEMDQFLRTISLQRHLTTRLELRLYEKLLRSLPTFHQVTLTATALTKGTNNWMTVLPTEPAYQMANDAFRMALRHRLGLLPVVE